MFFCNYHSKHFWQFQELSTDGTVVLLAFPCSILPVSGSILFSSLIKHIIYIVFTVQRKLKVNFLFNYLVLQSFQSELPWASCPNRYYGNGSYTAEPECVVSSIFIGQYLVLPFA
jgi:hypothetical protein